MAGIARAPWADANVALRVVRRSLPATARTAPGARHPSLPYLAYVPGRLRPLALLRGRRNCAATASFVFDADGNLWSGQNWMPGSQSGVSQQHRRRHDQTRPQRDRALAGNHRFHGHGLGRRRLGHWRVARQSLGRRPQRDDSGDGFQRQSHRHRKATSPMAGQLGGLMGVGVAANGDVWIADGTKNDLLYFPGGRVKDGRIVRCWV